MGMGIEKDGPWMKYSVPLKVSDQEWTVYHLRQLADAIENNSADIIAFQTEVRNSSETGVMDLQVKFSPKHGYEPFGKKSNPINRPLCTG